MEGYQRDFEEIIWNSAGKECAEKIKSWILSEEVVKLAEEKNGKEKQQKICLY